MMMIHLLLLLLLLPILIGFEEQLILLLATHSGCPVEIHQLFVWRCTSSWRVDHALKLG